MVARDSKAIRRALQRKGFRVQQGHHTRLILTIDGDDSGIRTYISHGTKDYGDSLLAAMSSQLHLSKAELLEFIDCKMSGEAYLALLRERGHIA